MTVYTHYIASMICCMRPVNVTYRHTRSFVISPVATPSSPATMFPKSPTWRSYNNIISISIRRVPVSIYTISYPIKQIICHIQLYCITTCQCIIIKTKKIKILFSSIFLPHYLHLDSESLSEQNKINTKNTSSVGPPWFFLWGLKWAPKVSNPSEKSAHSCLQYKQKGGNNIVI